MLASGGDRMPPWGVPVSVSRLTSASDLRARRRAGPYYNPHIQRPAYFPPSDGYRPPEDPLLGVARQLAATAELAARNRG